MRVFAEVGARTATAAAAPCWWCCPPRARPPRRPRPAHSRGHLYVTSYTEGLSHFVTSMTAPVSLRLDSVTRKSAKAGHWGKRTGCAAIGTEIPSWRRSGKSRRPATAFDVGFGGLALVVERVEVLLQTKVGGDARVDGAAKGENAYFAAACLARTTLSPSALVMAIRSATSSRLRGLGMVRFEAFTTF